MEVPISYEGLHEVCALCGSNAHDLDACPETPKGPLEVIVEKFGATTLQNGSESCSKAVSSTAPITEKWVTVSPKKRGRSFPFPRKKSTSKFAVAPASPSVKIVSNCSSPTHAAGVSTKAGGPSILPTSPAAEGAAASPVDPASQIVPAAATDAEVAQAEPLVGAAGPSSLSPPIAPAPSALIRHSPNSPQQFISSPNSLLAGTDMEDEDVAMFLNLEQDDEVQLSSESTKKRRLEMGEASSPSYSTS